MSKSKRDKPQNLLSIIRELRKAGRHYHEYPPMGLMPARHYYHGRKKIRRVVPEDYYWGEIDRGVALYLADRLEAIRNRMITHIHKVEVVTQEAITPSKTLWREICKLSAKK